MAGREGAFDTSARGVHVCAEGSAEQEYSSSASRRKSRTELGGCTQFILLCSIPVSYWYTAGAVLTVGFIASTSSGWWIVKWAWDSGTLGYMYIVTSFRTEANRTQYRDIPKSYNNNITTGRRR